LSESPSSAVIIGVDSHKFSHAAVAITELGTRLGQVTIPVSAKGYHDLEAWARCFGPVKAFGIEGTGSYGAGLSRFLEEQGHVLTGKMALIRHLAAFRPGPVSSTTASAKVGLRALARRWLALDEEIKDHDAHIEQFTVQCAPKLVEAYGIKANTAADMLLLVGDNPERIRSEAALAKLCGVCPIPASSGKTSRHRLNRGGDRQANAALYRVVIVRMRSHQPTLDYVKRRTAEGKSKSEIIRCLKRFLVREIFGHLCRAPNSAAPTQIAA
jgi:transposase